LISCFSSPPAWALSAARKFFIIHYFWKIGLTKHQVDLQIKVLLIKLIKDQNWSNWSSQIDLQIKVCIPQAQLKLYLSKDITRQNALFFMHVNPGMRRLYCRVGRIKLKWIIHRFTSDFYGSRKLLTSRIQIQKIMKNVKWKNPAPNFWKLWTRNMISIFIGLRRENVKFHKYFRKYLFCFAYRFIQYTMTITSWNKKTQCDLL
jgi:hypothetical protein